MSVLATLTKTEARLFVCDPMSLFWGLAFPAVLLAVIGLVFPGAQDPSPDLGGAAARPLTRLLPDVVQMGAVSAPWCTVQRCG